MGETPLVARAACNLHTVGYTTVTSWLGWLRRIRATVITRAWHKMSALGCWCRTVHVRPHTSVLVSVGEPLPACIRCNCSTTREQMAQQVQIGMATMLGQSAAAPHGSDKSTALRPRTAQVPCTKAVWTGFFASFGIHTHSTNKADTSYRSGARRRQPAGIRMRHTGSALRHCAALPSPTSP